MCAFFLFFLGPYFLAAQALVIKLSAAELSHVQRIATRCRDAKQCAAVFKDSFRGLAHVLNAHATHQTKDSAAVGSAAGSASSLKALGSSRAASAPPATTRGMLMAASASENPLAAASARVEALRLLQGLVIAYENMTVGQRSRAVLKEKAFADSLGALLEVKPPVSLFSCRGGSPLACFPLARQKVAMDCSQWDRRDGEGSHQYAALLAAAPPRPGKH
jgi:hypothetical protein